MFLAHEAFYLVNWHPILLLHDLLDRPAFVTFITAGYPHPNLTVDILLSLQRGGADVIELGKETKKNGERMNDWLMVSQGIPFTDPLADGPTIQYSNTASINIMFIKVYVFLTWYV